MSPTYVYIFQSNLQVLRPSLQKCYVFSGVDAALGQYTAGYLLGRDCARSLVSQLYEVKNMSLGMISQKTVSFPF